MWETHTKAWEEVFCNDRVYVTYTLLDKKFKLYYLGQTCFAKIRVGVI